VTPRRSACRGLAYRGLVEPPPHYGSDGRIALVTRASRGIGAAVARTLDLFGGAV
jgi:hypothetical protein